MDKLQLAPIIIGKLLNIGGMLHRHGNKLLFPFELNQNQFSIFFEISQAGKVNQKEMVNRLELEKAHVSKVVKKLYKMGLIKITIAEEDKRSAWLSPTKEGIKTLNSCMELFNKWNDEWTTQIEEKHFSSLLNNLTLLQTVFRDKTK